MTVETIVAIATPLGRGGIGVIRVSGPLCRSIANQVLGTIPKPRLAHFGSFRNQENIVDQGISLYFPEPHSFTGEDVLELHGHGGPVVLDRLLTYILSLGARMAKPGEFSERAFLNGKIDLIQAEAIADLIDSASTQAAKAAIHSLQGAFSDVIQQLLQDLIALRMLLEATIDFPDEEGIDALSEKQITSDLTTLIHQLESIFATAEQGALLREGITVVIAGRPNAGKSSLLNQLAEKSTAIVTEIPGTTRDVLREYIHIDGLPLHIVDTAGLHETADQIEQEGMRRALKEIEQADQILWVVDNQAHADKKIHEFWPEIAGSLPDPKKLTLLRNKIDLTGDSPEIAFEDGYASVKLCAKTGEGIEILKQHLKKIMGFNASGEGKFIARRRHLDALHRALYALKDGLTQFNIHHASELLAEDLRQAQLAMDEITGRFTSDDLLGEIFAGFCIGK